VIDIRVKSAHMAELKTKETKASVKAFVDAIEDEGQRKDVKKISSMMKAATGAGARMWGTSIIGFGNYHYRYASGREGDWFVMGISPRKGNISLYFSAGFAENNNLLKRLGKHKIGKGCLYIKSLSDIDLTVLEQLIEASSSKQSS
jgi:hypothetical protein